jgi:hypothetical protein
LNGLIDWRLKLIQFRNNNNILLDIKTQNATEILTECCKKKKVHAAILLLGEKRVYYHAWLVSVSDNLLYLRLTRKLNEAPAPGSSCHISFTYRNNGFSFFSSVLEYRHSLFDKHGELILDISSGIIRSEPSLAYRANVLSASQLVINIITRDGLILSPRVKALSLIGIGVAFNGTSANPKLMVGSFVEIEIRLPPYEVKLKGEVKHRIGSKYLIFFSTVPTKDGVNPPETLKSIVGALERGWLNKMNRAKRWQLPGKGVRVTHP